MAINKKESIPLPTPWGLKRDLLLRKPPFWMISALLILIALSFIPIALALRARMSLSPVPRVALFQDMGVQPRYGPQAPSTVFADGRAMRPPVPGTVARGAAELDDHYDRGFELRRDGNGQGWEVVYFDGLPKQLKADQNLLLRGRSRFDIYCAPCHGVDGQGDGPLKRRALELEEPSWLPPTSLVSDAVRQRQDGHLYNTIRNGIRTMPAYGPQIDVDDRWAIVTYIRALQRSQHATLDDVPADQRSTLK
ncbi:MAG: cytochrome c [Phycisphaeraceae bacterium]|nr:cytochrome c [Phycisphaeraceae bacterium]